MTFDDKWESAKAIGSSRENRLGLEGPVLALQDVASALASKQLLALAVSPLYLTERCTMLQGLVTYPIHHNFLQIIKGRENPPCKPKNQRDTNQYPQSNVPPPSLCVSPAESPQMPTPPRTAATSGSICKRSANERQDRTKDLLVRRP